MCASGWARSGSSNDREAGLRRGTRTLVGGELWQVKTGESAYIRGHSISEVQGASGKAQLASASAVTEALSCRGPPPSPHEKGVWEELHHK